ncbi:hypothetical protein ACLM5J_00575 [Nocardioides sp. Bht2]|uniref:hypothetical protein n=1 Tax=Nocardioides sp. Bht2 TaxID=3392297 RepID=UPI0039B6D284
MSTIFVETDAVELTSDVVSGLITVGGFTHPLFRQPDGLVVEDPPLPGQAVLLLAGGLVEQCGVLDDAVAMVEMRSARFHRMVRAGSRLRVRVEPGEARATRSQRWVQEFVWQVLDDAGALVATVDVVMLMQTKVEGSTWEPS